MGLRNQILKTVGGQLAKTSDEELQNQAQMSGMAATPTSPMEAGVLTQNPDVAKMAGTPANKLSAMRQSIKDNLNQQTQTRQRQDYQGPSAEAEKKKAALGQLAPLGSLDSRVQQITQTAFQGQATELKPAVDDTKLETKRAPGVSDDDWAKAKTSAANVAAGTATPADYVALARGMGKPTLSQAELSGVLSGPADAVSKAIQAATPNELRASQLYNTEELAQVGGVLGISPQDMSNYTVAQLQDAVNRYQTQQTTDVSKLKAMANSPDASPAERAQARRLLAESGASGERAAEEETKTLEQKVQDGDEITFMGRKMPVEEALKDESIAGAVKSYFDDAAFAENLKKTEPALAQLIESNRGQFQKYAQGIDDSAKAFNDTQTYNQNIGKMPDGSAISSDIMSKLIPGFGTPQADKFAEPPLLQAIKQNTFPASARSAIVQSLKGLTDSGLLDEFKSMSAQDLSALGLTGSTAEVQQKLDKAINYKTVQNEFAKTDAASSPEAFLSGFFGVGLKELQTTTLPNLAKQIALGGNPQAKQALAMLDANNDGKVDDVKEIQARLRQTPTGSLKDVLMGNASLPESTIKALPTTDSPLAQKLLGSIDTAGNLNLDVLKNKATKGQLSYDDLGAIAMTTDSGQKLKPELLQLQQQIGNNLYDSAVKSNTDGKIFKDITTVGGIGKYSKDDLSKAIDVAKTSAINPALPPAIQDRFKKQLNQLTELQSTYTTMDKLGKVLNEHDPITGATFRTMLKTGYGNVPKYTDQLWTQSMDEWKKTGKMPQAMSKILDALKKQAPGDMYRQKVFG